MILNNGLEEIEVNAFYGCRSLEHIEIPPAIKAIKEGAFCGCSGLTTGILGDGLEKILTWAFKGCVSLVRIEVPPDIKAIREGAFHGCSGLTTAILNSGLEVIEMHRDTTRNNCNQGLQIL